MAGVVHTIKLKEGMPRVEEARARLNAELERARDRGTTALKIIHGYGSSGTGGRLRTAIRNSLKRRQKEGTIRCFAAGERWSVFDEVARQILEECPELAKDPDLNGYNEGITIVLL